MKIKDNNDAINDAIFILILSKLDINNNRDNHRLRYINNNKW